MLESVPCVAPGHQSIINTFNLENNVRTEEWWTGSILHFEVFATCFEGIQYEYVKTAV